MRMWTQRAALVLVWSSFIWPVRAQDAVQQTAGTAVAATVNGQPISELTVQRGLRRVAAEKRAEARKEIITYLADNILLDQYLQQLRIEVPSKDIEARVDQIRAEIKKSGQEFGKVMEQMLLTESELRSQIAADMRWEKFCNDQITDKDQRELFAKNLEIFDGTMVRARHILLTPAAGDAQAAEQAKQKLDQLKKQLEDKVTAELSRLPEGTDKLDRERARCRLLNDTFAALAQEVSTCPSKEQGGDLGWFARSGSMVEPFARAAFALQPYTMSEIVSTQFGYHLILVTDRRQGKETKFEDVKEVVRDVCCDRLRESLCAKLRPSAQIVVASPPMPR
jgi:peptidyl-prolyl cis-trans isomerase C